MNIPYTPVSNVILRDSLLSLNAKGLYLILRSYAGLENFCLTKRQLKNTFSGSDYSFEQAWKELKSCGYLKHFYHTAKNGSFVHVYDLHQERQAVNRLMSYTPNHTRAHGDLRFIHSERVNDYTTVPNTIARDCTLSLKVKGLYAIVYYLFKIPDFHFSFNSLVSLCKEKGKALKTTWIAIKRSGLLKQHRHPTGDHNQFHYTYDLLVEPNLEDPYFTNHRADGTITSSLSVKLNTSVPKEKKKQKNTQIIQTSQSRKTETEYILPNIVRLQYYPISKYVDKAINALCKNKHMRLNGIMLSLTKRQKVMKNLTSELLEQFEIQFQLPTYVQKPIPYIASALYQFVQSPISRPFWNPTDKPVTISQQSEITDTTEDLPLTIDEMDCITCTIQSRINQARQQHSQPLPKDVQFTESYSELLTMNMILPAAEFEQRLRQLITIWKNQ